MAEYRVKAVSSAIRKIVNSRGGEWYQYIPSVKLAMNTMPNQATGYSAFLLQHGRMAREPASFALLDESFKKVPYKEYLVQLAAKVKVWRNVAQKNRQRYQRRMQEQYNRKQHVPNDLQPGELVYMKCPYLNIKNKGVKRLMIPYCGPFLVVDVIDSRLCRLARISDLIELPKLVAISRLKLTNLDLNAPEINDDPDIAQAEPGEWVPCSEEGDQERDHINEYEEIDEPVEEDQPSTNLQLKADNSDDDRR